MVFLMLRDNRTLLVQVSLHLLFQLMLHLLVLFLLVAAVVVLHLHYPVMESLEEVEVVEPYLGEMVIL